MSPVLTCVVVKSGSRDSKVKVTAPLQKTQLLARSGSRISGPTRGKLGHELSPVPTCVVAKSGSRDPKVKVTAPLQRTQLLPALEAAFRVVPAANLATGCPPSQRALWQNLCHVTPRSRSRRPCKEHNFCPLWKPHFGSYPRQTWPRVVPRPNVRRGKIWVM